MKSLFIFCQWYWIPGLSRWSLITGGVKHSVDCIMKLVFALVINHLTHWNKLINVWSIWNVIKYTFYVIKSEFVIPQTKELIKYRYGLKAHWTKGGTEFQYILCDIIFMTFNRYIRIKWQYLHLLGNLMQFAVDFVNILWCGLFCQYDSAKEII